MFQVISILWEFRQAPPKYRAMCKDGRGKSIGGGEPNETTSTEDLLHGQRPKTCHCLGKIHVAPSMLHHLQWMGTCGN